MRIFNRFGTSRSFGFTLIELLVVTVLIGILSGVLYSVINPRKTQNLAHEAVRINNVKKAAEMVETYAKLEGSYPRDLGELRTSRYVSNWPENVTYVADSSSFILTTPNSSTEYLVYSSYSDQIVLCPGEEVTEDCTQLSGGTHVAPCVPPNQSCETDGECCLEAPHCSGGVCRDCLAEGFTCGGSVECCDSAPYCIGVCKSCVPDGFECSAPSDCCSAAYCISDVCTDCKPAGYACSDESECCDSSPYCDPETLKCTVVTAAVQSKIDVKLVYDAILLATQRTGLPLGQITGNWCSDCACRDGNLNSLLCYNRWISARNRIDQAAGSSIVLSGIDRDPWGAPYLIDENELEWSYDPCRKDSIRSNGGYGLRVPFYTSTCL